MLSFGNKIELMKSILGLSSSIKVVYESYKKRNINKRRNHAENLIASKVIQLKIM